MQDDSGVKIFKVVLFSFIGLVVLLFIFGTFTVISAGERGVVVRVGAINRVLDPGIHLTMPLLESVEKITVQTQKEQVETDAASQDLQTVKATVAVNYNVAPEKVADLYRTLGNEYKSRVIDPAIQEAVKAATAKYTAEQLITQRPQVKEDIKASLSTILSPKDIAVSDVSITNFDFSPSFNAAIESKVTAEQQALQAKNKLAQVEYEKQQRIAQAQGEAEAIRIQAQAVTQQGGEDYVRLQELKYWNGSKCTSYCFGNDVPVPAQIINANK